MTTIHVITMGGTIEQSATTSTRPMGAEECLRLYLRKLNLPKCDIRITELTPVNGTEVSPSDKNTLLELVRNLSGRHLATVITHSMRTMLETAGFLQSNVTRIGAPVILTGAMSRYGSANSDGLQNLTESVFAARVFPVGVYMVMHGSASKVVRDAGVIRMMEFSLGHANENALRDGK
jgi:L-asparaginase